MGHHRLFNPLGFLLAIVVFYGGELLIHSSHSFCMNETR